MLERFLGVPRSWRVGGLVFPQPLWISAVSTQGSGLVMAEETLPKGHCRHPVRSIPQTWESWKRVRFSEANVWGGAAPCSGVWIAGTAAWCKVPKDPVTSVWVHLKGKTSSLWEFQAAIFLSWLYRQNINGWILAEERINHRAVSRDLSWCTWTWTSEPGFRLLSWSRIVPVVLCDDDN